MNTQILNQQLHKIQDKFNVKFTRIIVNNDRIFLLSDMFDHVVIHALECYAEQLFEETLGITPIVYLKTMDEYQQLIAA